jgi:HlyD family secretion protein
MNSTDEQPNRRRRWVKRAALALFAVALAGLAGRNLLLGTPIDVYEAARGDLVQTVVASGRIITPRRVSIGVVITGRVARIPVQEGQTVRAGEVLIELEGKDERAAVAQARANVAQAEAKLRQLREVVLPAAEQALVQAQANALQARQQFDRNKALQEKGFVGQSALDDAKRNLDVADSQLRAARLQVETNGPKGSDYLLAQTALEQARASLQIADAKLEQTVIHAPVDGVLISRSVEPGNVVQPGKELMALAPAGETQIDVLVDEKNLAQLALGQTAVGSADAFPSQRFAAELTYINPGIDPLRGAVEVKLRVPQPPDYLRQDMTVSVDIEVARRAGTVIAPTDAVRDLTGAQPWVLMVKDGRATRQPVKLGLRGDGRLEILDGVAPGNLLVPASNPLVAAGERVRVDNVMKEGAK